MPHTFIKERRCLLPNINYLHIKNYAMVKKGENSAIIPIQLELQLKVSNF